MTDTLPAVLAGFRDDFLALGVRDRLELLLEFSNELPALPARYAEHPDLLERVEECQSPVFIFVEVGGDDGAPGQGSDGHGHGRGVVTMHATAPREAPTTRGFASILAQGLSGLTADEVLALPTDYPLTLGLTEAVSPLRIRGMVGMLGRVQRQVAAKADTAR